MESSAAGYLDAKPLIAETYRRLVALRPRAPVLSLYLDLDPTALGTQRDHRSAYTSLLDEAHKRVERHDADHDGRASLRADLERAAQFLDGYRPERGRGVAIFAASAGGLFEAYTLPRPPRTEIFIGDSPYVAPLIAAADARDWLVVVVDARHARFLHGNPDRVEEIEHVEDRVPGQHERQRTSDHQRWVEHNVDAHLKKAADELDRQLGSARFDRVVIGGPPEIVPRFEELMSNPAREKLAGRFSVEVPDTIADDVRKAATECFEEAERAHERELLDRLAARLGRGERAVAGISDVRGMLEEGRVETLLYAEAYERAEPAALEQAIEATVAQAGEVLALRHFPDELAEHGHIAATLRY